MEVIQFCKADLFRYITKLSDLKDELYLRYNCSIDSIKNICINLRHFHDISSPIRDRILKF
jgi:hypothetical protein